MPFRPGQSFTDVNRGLDRFSDRVNRKAGQAVYAAAVTAGGISKTMTPIDTSTLVNSQYVAHGRTSDGWRAEIGYTAAYALAVHSMPGTLSGEERANGNGFYWEPRGMTRFLARAFEGQERKEVDSAFYKALKI